MKNEDRIVALSSESLKRQDQMVEGFQRMEKSINNLENRMERVEKGILGMVSFIDGLADLVEAALGRTKRIDEIENRVKRIEKHTGLDK